MNNVKRLYDNGMKVKHRVAHIDDHPDYRQRVRGYHDIPEECEYGNLDDMLFLTWKHDFSGDYASPSDKIFFSYNHPYSFQDSLDLGVSLHQ